MQKGIFVAARLLQCLPGIALTACIIPIPGEVEASDGGVDLSPFIKSATPAPPGGIDLPPMLLMTVEDGNVTDEIFLRAFRDYEGTPFLDKTQAFVTGTLERSAMFMTNTWCNGATPGDHEFSVVVADRPFFEDTSVKPEYQAVTLNGKSTTTYWTFRCGGL